MRRLLSQIFILIPLLAAVVAAAQTGEQVFKIKGRAEVFVRDEGRRLLLSKACYRPDGKPSCAAYRALESASFKKQQATMSGGADPGAMLCEGLGGQVVTGADRGHNEQSFCLFSDQSLVGSDSIHAHAIENDER